MPYQGITTLDENHYYDNHQHTYQT